MANRQKGFVMYYSYKETLDLLTDEERGKLLSALLIYGETGEKPELEGEAKLAFSFLSLQMDIDKSKYDETCQRLRSAGKKGGRPRKDAVPEGFSGEEKGAKASLLSEKAAGKHKKENKKEKETEKEIENIPLSPPAPSQEGEGRSAPESVCAGESGEISPDGFEEFWRAYPKKVGKKACLAEWRRLSPPDELRKKIARALVWQKSSTAWGKEEGRFIPNPLTWLRQGQWDNEPTEAPPGSVPGSVPGSAPGSAFLSFPLQGAFPGSNRRGRNAFSLSGKGGSAPREGATPVFSSFDPDEFFRVALARSDEKSAKLRARLERKKAAGEGGGTGEGGAPCRI